MLPNGTKLVPSESPEMSAERKTTTAMVPATSNLPAALAMSAASSLVALTPKNTINTIARQIIAEIRSAH